MKSRIAVALTILCLLISPIGTLPFVSAQQATTQAATIQLPGLRQRVTIRRDERGIPYIEAQNDEDLYFAQGYATASDRLWQMDLLRRTERGELAEVLTAGPNNIALNQDKLHRTLGFARVAEVEFAKSSPHTKASLEAYARGVNAYIASLDNKTTPPEFQILQYKPKPWTPIDSLLVIKVFAEALSSSWRLDIMREALAGLPAEKRAGLLPETSPLDVVVVGKDTKPLRTIAARSNSSTDSLSKETIEALARDQAIESHALSRLGIHAESLGASNNWVVSGKRTTTGKPLLANDPHLVPSAPSIWYMVHLSAPGLRVAGVTAPGLPGVVIGHNDRIAWGMTNVGADVQDLYLEKFDPADPKRYQTASGWRDAEIRREQIKVRKGFADASTDIVNHDVTVTKHGPIVFEQAGRRYALRWTALEVMPNADLTQGINRAGNWKEFTSALKSFPAPTQNIVYADVDGHIGYHVAGVVPVRKSGDGSVPYDGSTDAGEWVSYVPPDKLPQLFDPPSGTIVTANQRIVGTDYPYHLTHFWLQPYRARRIVELLNAKPKFSADDFRRIQGDVYSIGGVLFVRQTAKILRAQSTTTDAKLAETIGAFEKWDGQINAESRAALLMVQMRAAFRTRVLAAALGEELIKIYGWANFETTLDRLITEQPKEWLPKEFTSYAGLLRACHNDARSVITKSLGEDESKWKWGEMVKVRFQHPLSPVPFIGAQFTIPPFPQNGTVQLASTVNVGAYVSMRLIADPGNWDNTQHGITLGISGIPSSPHWKDQLDDWRAVTPRAFPFSEAAVAKATKEMTVLEPMK